MTEKTYRMNISGSVEVEGASADAKPMAELDIIYRDLTYKQMAEMEELFFVKPLDELNEKAQKHKP